MKPETIDNIPASAPKTGPLKWARRVLYAAVAVAVVQFLYFSWVCLSPHGPDFKPDLVVVFGGDPPSTGYGLDLAEKLGCHAYISETSWKLGSYRDQIKAMGPSLNLDLRAQTTDQNARYAAPFILKGGYKRIALVCSWHHEPRALFLARLYLAGSGTRVRAYPYEPPSGLFCAEPLFWVQMIKFWGSLARVGLDLAGIDDWPPPQFIKSESDNEDRGKTERAFMRILMVNNHYFNYRGADRYYFNVKEGLEKAGHSVIPFSFDYDPTYETPFRAYFPEPITGRGPFLLKDMALSPAAKVKTAIKMFRNPEVDGKFRALVRDSRPDLVYSIYLSFTFIPNILGIAKREFGLPVVYRLSDYHMFCASYLFFRDGSFCTDCLSNPLSAVRHKCVHGSTAASALRAVQIRVNRWRGYYANVDRFICPSSFMRNMLVKEGGFPEEQVVHLSTFTKDLRKEAPPPDVPYLLYFGAIVRAKGVEVLLRAFNRIQDPPFRLRLIGDVSEDYQGELNALLDAAHRPLAGIEGELKGEELWDALRGALCVVHPVLWFENMPNSILEAMSAGKPVVGSDIGSMPELVQEGVNGSLVPPGDVEALSAALMKAADPEWVRRMSEGAREKYLRDHAPGTHLERLIGIMEDLIEKSAGNKQHPV